MVELQRLLWLYSPILDRQALLQLLQMNSVRGSVGTDAALSRLRSLIPMLLSHLLKRLSALTEGLHGQ